MFGQLYTCYSNVERYHPKLSQWSSTPGPSGCIHCAVVFRTWVVNPCGPQQSTRALWLARVWAMAAWTKALASGRWYVMGVPWAVAGDVSMSGGVDLSDLTETPESWDCILGAVAFSGSSSPSFVTAYGSLELDVGPGDSLVTKSMVETRPSVSRVTRWCRNQSRQAAAWSDSVLLVAGQRGSTYRCT